MPRQNDWDRYRSFPPSAPPRRVKDGIKAQTQRGTFGNSWWAKRWIGVLENFDIGSRLARGRAYARTGQVIDISITAGHVAAKVQGSQTKPYTVTMVIQQLSQVEWQRVVQAVGAKALFVAQLLNGVMPQDIERAFALAHVSLFPTHLDEITTVCSCPDWSNPCKHSAAVYYLLGEEFDRDPFLLFALRGLERNSLLTQLGTMPDSALSPSPLPAPLMSEPLPHDMQIFWGVPLEDSLADNDIPQLPPMLASLPRRLGYFPFWRGERELQEALAEMYQAAARQSLDLLSGEYHTETT